MNDVKKKIALLSNITIDLVTSKLSRNYDFYIPEGFDTWVQEVINPISRFYNEKIDAVIVLLDGTETRSWNSIKEGKQRVSLWKQALNILTNNSKSVPIFISTIDFRENRIKSLSERRLRFDLENDWYRFIQGLIEKKSNVFLFDLADTIAEIGRNQFYSNKMWYMSSMPYSRDGLNIVSNEINRILCSAFSVRKKIIVLDLDNTLWGGVIGEDGLEGIELSDHKEGQRYYDFQRQLLEMKKRGVMLAVNSKNNEEDAEVAFQRHPSMLLRDDDFVSRKINWENKDVNLQEIESELNLTESGFIFIDDNPVEREIVKDKCPEILVPDFPADTSELLGFAEKIWFEQCRPLRIVAEDLKKTEMYLNEAKRIQEKKENLNLDDYIAKLEMVINIHKMRLEEIDRVTQLINKTNQFNVTTKRYTQVEIEEIASNPGNVIYVIYSSDKYGDNGLISVIILLERNKDVWIDTFLMSCRVMSRKLEEVIINEIASKYSEKRSIIGEFIPTTKNMPVKELFDRLGFSLVSDDNGHKVYELNVSGYKKKENIIYKKIEIED